jgi:hypothetical protein
MRVLYFFVALVMTTACSSDHGLGKIPDQNYLNPGDSVDLVMVFDTSCSMMSDWTIIDYGLIRTAEDFYDSGIDVNIGLTSADWTPPGESTNQQVWYEVASSPDIGWDLALSLGEVRDHATGGESGFAGAISAYQNFPSFFRRNSTPIFLMVSDEKEQSTIDNVPITVSQFESMIPWNSMIVSVVGPDQDGQRTCADIAPKYHQASDLTIDICTQQRWSIVDELIRE